MIQMALMDKHPKAAFEFDTPARKIQIYHDGAEDSIEQILIGLGLGANLEYTEPVEKDELNQILDSLLWESSSMTRMFFCISFYSRPSHRLG